MLPFRINSSEKRRLDSEDQQSRKRFASDSFTEEYWMVQWREPQSKKHKTWDGDAVLVASASKATLFDIDEKIIAVGRAEFPLFKGKTMSVSTKEIELDRPLTRNEYLTGQAFGSSLVVGVPSVREVNSAISKRFVPLVPKHIAISQIPVQEHVDTRRQGTLQSINHDSPMRDVEVIHWIAHWRKPQNKKHQTWDGDAYISRANGKLLMIAEDGKMMGSITWNGDLLVPGYRIMINGKEVELDIEIDASQLPVPTGSSNVTRHEKDPSAEDSVLRLVTPREKLCESITRAISPASFYASSVKTAKPRHDPDAEGAIVMKAPSHEHIKKYNTRNLPVTPVVLDPILSNRMRPHQIDGVKFMYEAVMGFRKHEGQGCVLADEMGLGKTLQTIALVWTLLKQNPYGGTSPVVRKVLIVCPVSLVNNWKAEFYKWLGRDRVGVVTCDKNKKSALMFMNARNQHVLIIGYERLRTVIDDLAVMSPPIGIIICDEGHRLKSANNKTTKMFRSLPTRRRIILSGTPIQNDLSEFHTMAEFCNPGLLDEYNIFRRVYETPILKSRAPGASPKDIDFGEARTARLLSIAKSFVLRRDATLLSNVLPPKHEYVVFVTPTRLQLSIFSKILCPDRLEDLERGTTADSLALINLLTKVSNSPILLRATADKNPGGILERAGITEALSFIPCQSRIDDTALSGKLSALAKLLEVIRSTTEEKCVLVSHYTSTLNILEAFCHTKRYSYFRLDGQTAAAKRQELVNAFNKSSRNQGFIFLLSSKAGGVGINLIGASRLCLIDSDWNPSYDLQAMARCHRDGQKRPVYIYRFFTTGTIDEKIYQRQVTKLDLSSSVMESSSKSSKGDSFTKKDLLDIFRIDLTTACNTHDLLECPCAGEGFMDDSFSSLNADNLDDVENTEVEQGFIKACEIKQEQIKALDRAYLQKKKAGLASLGEWKHINCLRPSSKNVVQDDVLRKLIHAPADENIDSQALLYENVTDKVFSVSEVPGGSISYLFQKSSTALSLQGV